MRIVYIIVRKGNGRYFVCEAVGTVYSEGTELNPIACRKLRKQYAINEIR